MNTRLAVGAILWARENVWRYGGDHNQLVLVGHSAGAHLAALCLSDTRWLEEEGAAVGPSSPATAALTATQQRPPLQGQITANFVSGFVGISGVYDVVRMGGNVVGGVLARAAFGDDRRAWRQASPVHRVRAAATAAVAAAAGRPSSTAAIAEAATLVSVATSEARLAPESEGASADRDEATTRISRASVTAGDSTEHIRIACPLMNADVLLLTASSDFHLKDDAEALAGALDEARGDVDAARKLVEDEGEEAAGDATSRIEPGDVRDTRTAQPRSSRRPRTCGSGGGSGAPQAGNTEKGLGSVRHVCIEGENHLSMIVSFGEPGKEASDAVLNFILGLPPPTARA